jgi:hypothetical protein
VQPRLICSLWCYRNIAEMHDLDDKNKCEFLWQVPSNMQMSMSTQAPVDAAAKVADQHISAPQTSRT